MKDYEKSIFVKEFFRRRRDFIEKCFKCDYHGDNFLINGEDVRIIEQFKKEHNIREGFGVDPFLAYVINYYKNKLWGEK